MRPRRGALLTGFAVLALPLVVASLAWACSPSKSVSITTPGPVLPGGTVGIRGVAWEPGPIEIRWQSPTGARLPVVRGTAQGPNFAIDVTVPDRLTVGAQYKIFVLGPASLDNNGGIPTTNNADLTITAGEAAVRDPEPTPIDPTPTPTPTPTPATPSATPNPAVTPAQPAADDTSVFEPSDAAAAPQRSTTASPRVVALPDRDRPAAGSVAPVATPSGAVAPAPRPADDGLLAVPSSRAVGSDLWSGFATGDQRGASLVDSGATPASDRSMGTGLAVLGLGLIALLAGVGVAVRRRPVKVVTKD